MLVKKDQIPQARMQRQMREYPNEMHEQYVIILRIYDCHQALRHQCWNLMSNTMNDKILSRALLQ
jgi:protein involved in ribonucleotide reduction